MKMLQGSPIKGQCLWRDEVPGDGGARYFRHAHRYAEERFWRREAEEEMVEEEVG